MTPSTSYFCSCLSPIVTPPAPGLPSSSASFHPLHSLFFCEECDAVRCNRCVSVEVSGYYCPNCLFEVPSASVRAERNRCARNCFQCPQCYNILSAVPSDPPEDGNLRLSTSQAVLGEPPFLLYCNNCRWDSAEVGITFEKPTGLAQQLQRHEDSAPEFLEFERLKDHFEPFLRSPSNPAYAPGTSHHSHGTRINPITAAASSALARDIPGVSKYNPPSRSRGAKNYSSGSKDDIPVYKSRIEIGGFPRLGSGGEADVDLLRTLESPAEISNLQQRWPESWATSPSSRELKPIRVPLHSRLTKRCPACRHILIKPEQKAQSVRYKIKLVAANYLPVIVVSLPNAAPNRITSQRAAGEGDQSTGSSTGMLAGKTYPFHLAFTNPLYDPIQVRLAVQRQSTPSAPEDLANTDKPRRPHFAVSLPTSAFSVAAFAEAWEYEDDEGMFDADDDALLSGELSPVKDRSAKGKTKTKTVGVIEKKANLTVVGGEVVIGKEGRGDVKFNMLVSYTYRSDEPPLDDNDGEPKAKSSIVAAKPALETKTFSFYTVIDLGSITARDDLQPKESHET